MKTKSEKRLGKNVAAAAIGDAEIEPNNCDRLQRIETAAYYKAAARGFAPGMEVDDWLQAEVEVAAEEKQ